MKKLPVLLAAVLVGLAGAVAARGDDESPAVSVPGVCVGVVPAPGYPSGCLQPTNSLSRAVLFAALHRGRLVAYE